VFNPATLARIDAVTSRFQALPEISQVLSLTDILDIKKIPDGIEVGKLIPLVSLLVIFGALFEFSQYSRCNPSIGNSAN